MSDVNVKNCQANFGGGLYINDITGLTLTNSFFDTNKAIDFDIEDASPKGGAIYYGCPSKNNKSFNLHYSFRQNV